MEDLRRKPIRDAITHYENYLREFPPEDVTHLAPEIVLAFNMGKIARDGKAATANKACMCPHCGKVYSSKANMKIHIKGSKKRKPSCPYVAPLPFLPRLPHPTDARFCRTAEPDDANARYKGRKILIQTTRFDAEGNWEKGIFIRTHQPKRKRGEKKPAPPILSMRFFERAGRLSKFKGKWQSLTSKPLNMIY